MSEPATNTETTKDYIVRFTRMQRVEHLLLIVSFTGLAITGLPQRYAETELGIRSIEAMGGIESIRILHRIFAVMLTAGSIYHGGVLTYNIFVKRARLDMLPNFGDVRDVIQWTLYNLGLRKEHPKLPRFNFIEKAEYLAVVWGTVIMIITGFMLWNPVLTAEFLPGSFIPAALAAHSAEAFLAVAAIILWHMYHVILKQINPSMFTGKMSREAMEEEHAGELELIDEDRLPQPPSEDVLRKRTRVFIPYATVVTIILVGLLIRFVTVETTAIETVPRVVSTSDADAALTVSADDGDIDAGAAHWQELPCSTCHGSDASGLPGALNIALAGTSLDFEVFVQRVRSGPADMPAYPRSEISDQQLADLYVWLQSLDRP